MRVCVTGGAGYVGSVLVPHLIRLGHEVTVLDLFWFGDFISNNSNALKKIKGDIRNKNTLRKAFAGHDAVIHLACVSNDPSFNMRPALGESINYDCFKDMLTVLKEAGIGRFIYASSSSVYGVSNLEQVTEDSPKNPLPGYSACKLKCELELKTIGTRGCWTIIRPATVCGYSPRQRLDLAVNTMAIQAIVNKKMTVHGGQQIRPNINIQDMVGAYAHVLEQDVDKVNEKTYNVGFENLSLLKIAELVRDEVGGEIDIEDVVDKRSYRVNSDFIKADIGFEPKYTIKNAIASIKNAYEERRLPDPLRRAVYSNIKHMKEIGLV